MAAGNAVIGALRVVLGADTASLEKGIKGAQGKLASFGASVAKAGAAAAAAMAAAGVGVAVAVKRTINEADKLGKSAQKWGVGVEELSRLKHAADLSGVSFEGLGTGVARFNRNIVEAAQGLSTPMRAFAALGIEIRNTDGSLKTVSDLLPELAGRFSRMRDGPEKTALAMQLLGRSGAEMIPLLNSGADGLKAMMDEADQLGIVISTKTAKAAEAFNDNLTRLGKVKDGIITQITAQMLPNLERLSAQLVVTAKDANLMKSAGEAMGNMLESVARVAMHIPLIFQRMGAEWNALRAFLKTDIFSGKIGEAWAKFRAEGEETVRQFEALRAKLDTAHLADAFGAIGTGAAAAGEGIKTFTPTITGAASAIDKFLESQNRSLVAQRADLQTTGMAAGAKERLRVVLQGLAVAQEQGIPITDALRLKLSEAAFAAEQMALKIQGAQLIQQNLAPHEAFRIELENNRRAMEAFGATAEQIGRANQAVAERYGATWQQVGQSVAGSFKQIGDAFGKESKGMALVAKAAGIVQATISMFVGAAKALELPFPANLAAWASVLATGASMIAGVKGVNAGGFATGGAITVPGGEGGGDRVRAMVDLQPGEQLDIWRPDHGGTDPRRGGGAAQYTTVFVHLPELGAEFWGAAIRKINGAVKEGYRLEIAPA